MHPCSHGSIHTNILTRILKILKIVTPLCGYTYPQHQRVANSVAIFKIFKIRVKKIFRRTRMRGWM